MTTEDEVLHRVATTIGRTLKGGAGGGLIKRETTAEDVQGWDSLTHAVLMMAVEREFCIELPLEETIEMTNVGDLVDVIQRLIV